MRTKTSSTNWPVWLLFAGATALHLILSLTRPLSEDETYYWEWSRSIDWGYYDGGPMIAWWMRALCAIFGETVLGVRAGAVVASLLLMIVAYVSVRDFFGEKLALWSTAALSLTPLAIVGGFLFTYDILQVLFWALAIYATSKAVEQPSISWWLLVGVCLGLGLLSKLTMALFVPCMFLFLWVPKQNRKHTLAVGPWLAITIGFLIYLPNLIWQANHDWISFRHMSTISSASLDKPVYSRLGDFLGAQVAVISPLLFFACIFALLWAARKEVREGKTNAWLLWCFSATVLLFFVLSTFRGKVLGNWAASGWYGACLLAPIWASQSAKRWKFFVLSLIVSAVLTSFALWPEVMQTIGIKIPQDWRRQSDRMFGGEELARAATKIAGRIDLETGQKPRFAANGYQEAGRLGFYLPGQPRVYGFFVEARKNQYVFWNEAHPPRAGESFVLALDFRMRDDRERPIFAKLFERIEGPEEVPIFVLPSDAKPAHTYYLYRLYHFRG